MFFCFFFAFDYNFQLKDDINTIGKGRLLAEVSFRFSDETGVVDFCIHDFSPPVLTEMEIKRQFDLSEYREFRFIEGNVPEILAAIPSPTAKTSIENVPGEPEPVDGDELEAALEASVDMDMDIHIYIYIYMCLSERGIDLTGYCCCLSSPAPFVMNS